MNPARSSASLAAFTLGLSTLACGGAPAPASPAPVVAAPSASASATPAAVSALDQLRRDAKRLDAIVTTPGVKRFLARVATLPHVATRTLYHDEKKTHFYTEKQASALPPAEMAALKTRVADEELYYNTKYGSPLSYARPLDILFSKGLALPQGAKVLDFGHGYIGHLRLLATMGVDATGVDVDPLLTALYGEPGDQGDFQGPEGEKGQVRLLEGRFPADPAIASAVGTGYDLVISKNVLKKGYIHPDRPAEEKFLIKLGASDEVVLKSFFDALKPGGKMLVYNICPAPTPLDKPFIPWSDGRSPFTRQQWEAAGFAVAVFDQDDTAAVRVMGHALGWGDDPEEKWDLDHDLSVLYTLVERPK
jgi:SAM-dependent methyltransferase